MHKDNYSSREKLLFFFKVKTQDYGSINNIFIQSMCINSNRQFQHNSLIFFNYYFDAHNSFLEKSYLSIITFLLQLLVDQSYCIIRSCFNNI